MRDLMIDLETMSTLTPTAAIVGIGAVEFDLAEGKIGETFFRAVNLGDACNQGGHIEPGTVSWWLMQSKEAQNAISFSTHPLSKALEDLATFISFCGSTDEVRPWGNGPSFDLAMLSYCYKRAGMEVPWKFWNERCVRTIRSLYPHVEREEFHGEAHNAVDDAMNQVKHLIKIRNSVMKK